MSCFDPVAVSGAAKSPRERVSRLLDEPDLAPRLERLRRFGRRVRSSEYHLTTACNLRCEGCWFFEYDFDQQVEDRGSLVEWQEFARAQAASGITSALLIGGEPTLYPDRVSAFVEAMPFVTISTNGLRELPFDGFERVAIALTVFAGGEHDDKLRAIRPSGERFSGLFDVALRNYKNDPRVNFVYAMDPECVDSIESTVRRICDNGNQVSFNYYSRYGGDDPLRATLEDRLLDEALRVADTYRDAVNSHPYFLRALITGKTDWGLFGYGSCPSISTDHPAHANRLKNGNPVLPHFNSYAADRTTVNFCCTSGECEGCRDSQAVYSWLLTNIRNFIRSGVGTRTWVEIAESYWRQFVWSDHHRSSTAG